MAIFVVCPGCRTRFNVSDKFAGKSGPCPKCKTIIQIPKLSEQVVIHEPEQFASGGRTQAGKLATKPIARPRLEINAVTAAAVIGAILVVAVGTLLLGRASAFENPIVRIVGLLLVTPAIAAGGYAFLHSEDELFPLQGRRLYVRAVLCAAGYLVIWAGLEGMRGSLITSDIWTWVVFASPLFLVGGFVAYLTMDLDYGDGLLHFALFVLVTVLLRWAAGIGWIWDIPPDEIPLA
ncbi:MAG: hypothetical protein GYA33_06630 [Thermogutta sp.]|nr:hypothetical protein [Thermogutta sp.]